MKPFCHRISILILISLFQGSGCKQDDALKPLPDLTITAVPSAGKTTDIFEITLAPQAAPEPVGDFRTFNQWNCLFEQSIECEQIGKMYFVSGAIENRGDNEFAKICPNGWRLPTKQDWETLLNNIGGQQNGKELRFGGKYDFNASDLGYGTYYFVYDTVQNPPIPKDTLYFFKDTYQKSWFFSTTEAQDPQNLRMDIWMLNLDRATQTTWTGFQLPYIYVPARCIKEN